MLLRALLLAQLQVAAPAPPLVIAHRGASGYRPEHTLEAYQLALAQGAEALEPDLVVTKDGVLVCRHEPELSATTDVARRFPRRRATRVAGRDTVSGWWVDDFTLAELKTLRVRQRFPSRGTRYDDYYQVATFAELLALAERVRREEGRPIAVYPELKEPAYFRARGLPIEELLVKALDAARLTEPRDPVFVQSFDVEALERVRQRSRVRLVLLLDRDQPLPDLGLAAQVIDGLGVHKELVQPLGPDGALGAPTTLVADAHARGLFVHAWTFRADAPFLPKVWRGDAVAELIHFRALGVDGVFTDQPDVAVRAFGGRER